MKQGNQNYTIANNAKGHLEEKTIRFQRVDLPFITIKYIKEPIPIGRRRLRLYLDLIDTWYPIYKKADNETKAQFISDIFKCICTSKQLEKLATFKDITHKKVITMKDENVQTITRLRWRSRDNVRKNIIHFQK